MEEEKSATPVFGCLLTAIIMVVIGVMLKIIVALARG